MTDRPILDFKDFDLAARYRKFRPTYPRQLYQEIIDFMTEKLTPPFTQAIDVGCGSGQVTRDIAKYFDDVVGIDISDAQLREATTWNNPSNVTYRQGSFTNLQLPVASCDLVIAGQVAHFFHPIDEFYAEADRVLKQNGVLAMFGYKRPTIHVNGHQNDHLTKLLSDTFFENPCYSGYVSKDMQKLVVNGYRDLPQPYLENKRINTPLQIKKTMTLNDITDYLRTKPYYFTYRAENPDLPDPVDELADRFEEYLIQLPGDISPMTAVFDMFIVASRKT